MAEPRENEFLDDIDDAEAEAYADEMSEIDDEAMELDELRAERDQLKDRFMRALAEEQRTISGPLLEGIELTMRELLHVFKKHGMEMIAPEVGDKFDPQQHQAMFEAPVPGTKAGEIIQVAAEGFMLHDRLLRPAQVGVSSMPAG